MKQLELLQITPTANTLSTTPQIDALIASHAPVAVGVSGGKDGAAAALALDGYLDRAGHLGPRVLVHSHLGQIEWTDSLLSCQRLAAQLGWELIVVERAAGGMVERWEQRWRDNVRRYVELSCVRLILPWSTAGMRFCTSELKVAVITRELRRRFPGQQILNVTGIRREESAKRAKAPIAGCQPKLEDASGTSGLDWHPILDWSTAEVFAYLAEKGLPLPGSYTVWGSSRHSCTFCVLASGPDLAAAARCPANTPVYRRLVRLEAASTFAFRKKWLGDVAPHLLSDEERQGLAAAKRAAMLRRAAEKRLPKHLLYRKGWPTCIPTQAEAELLCEVRLEVGAAVGLPVLYTMPDAVIDRYQELLAAKSAKKPTRKRSRRRAA